MVQAHRSSVAASNCLPSSIFIVAVALMWLTNVDGFGVTTTWTLPLARRGLTRGVGGGCRVGVRRRESDAISMQQRPDGNRRAGTRSRPDTLTAMQMTMTKSKRPGGGAGSGRDRMPEFFEQVLIVVAGAVIGGVTGLTVMLFKSGIAATREFTYQGGYSDFVDYFQRAIGKAGLVPGGIPSTINLEFVMYPLLGGIVTSLLLFATRTGTKGDFGPALSGQLEELQRGRPVSLPRFVARETAAIAALGTGCSLGPEGPSVEIGITISRVASDLLSLDGSLRKVLAAAGAAAGVSAGFNAPLTGVVFALEILLPSLNAAEIANAKRYALSQRKAALLSAAAKNLPAKTTVAAARDLSVNGRGREEMMVEPAGEEVAIERLAVSKATAGAVLTASAISCLIARSGIVNVASERFTVANYELVNAFVELPFYMTLGILTGIDTSAMHCNTLHETATYCNTLQHTATPCNIPPMRP